MKKSKFRFLIYLSIILFTGILLMAFTLPQDKKTGPAWEIPANYKAMKNPYADDASLTKVGRMLYSKHCKSCHGAKGLGDGPKAASLETGMHSFASADFQAQGDGVVYYQSYIGIDEMPNFEKKIPDDEDRWAIINYMRTLK